MYSCLFMKTLMILHSRLRSKKKCYIFVSLIRFARYNVFGHRSSSKWNLYCPVSKITLRNLTKNRSVFIVILIRHSSYRTIFLCLLFVILIRSIPPCFCFVLLIFRSTFFKIIYFCSGYWSSICFAQEYSCRYLAY